ncbi:oligopeptide transport system ATP-binding protein [Candidatus Kryptobacter tengchongensis]|nr:oligopeptide transport system ATP-binding protein [Candidatus Kryptobacter tengchongensis]
MALLDVKNLKVSFKTARGIYNAVKGVSFKIDEGEVFALVGESGAGKSITARAILRLVGDNSIIEGEILWKDRDLLKLDEKEMRKLRGAEIAMVFQNPQMALNPAFTIKKQFEEVIKLHNPGLTKDSIIEMMKNLLGLVQAEHLFSRIDDYPHQFSVGEAQRIFLGMVLACKPKLLIADEPTSGLDVTVQSEILSLLKDIREKFNTAILLISHDLAIVSSIASRIAVMYKGEIIECDVPEKIFLEPQHSYTEKLINSIPVPKILFANKINKINNEDSV